MSTVREEWSLACPDCGCDDCLQIELTTMADLTPDGADPFGDQEWDHGSYMRCDNCGKDGHAIDFHVEKVTP